MQCKSFIQKLFFKLKSVYLKAICGYLCNSCIHVLCKISSFKATPANATRDLKSLQGQAVETDHVYTLNLKISLKGKWEGAHHPYLQLGELNCEGRSSRGLVEGILKAPRAAALRPNVTEHSYDGRVG